MPAISNVHERVIDASAAEVWDLVERVGGPEDVLWPSPAWVPMRLDRPLAVGADGGHGPIRYHVTDVESGRRVRFTFHPQVGVDGYHEFQVESLGPGRCRVRHVLAVSPRARMRVLWPTVIRWLHDAVLEDLLDNAERATTGAVAQPATWSNWVRLLRRFDRPRPAPVPLPGDAALVRSALRRIDFADAWQVRLRPGLPTDPQTWARAVFRDPPRWVGGLLFLRNALVGLVGIERGDRSAFDVLAVAPAPGGAAGGEALLGTDAGHLDFRASVLVDSPDRTVTLSTVVTVHNARGRLYMAIVRGVHPMVVRAMLARAVRQLATGWGATS